MHHEKNPCLVENHASRKSHALRKIMHCESTIMHDEKISCLVKIYTSREDFIPRWNLDIARRIYTSLEFVHHKKDPCLVGNHELRVNNYARREEFIPCQNLYIARRFHALLKVMHREKIHTSRKFTYRGKIFIPRKRTYMDKERAIPIHWPRLHYAISYKSTHQKSIEDNDKRNINIASSFIYVFRLQI